MELTDAEIGLIQMLLQEDVIEGKGSVYRVIVTGESAYGEDLLAKFVELMVQGR